MLLFDVNVYVYALRKDSDRHEEAIRKVNDAASGQDSMAWHPLIGSAIVRIVTNPRIYVSPTSHDECFLFINRILDLPIVKPLVEDRKFWETFERLVRKYRIVGPAMTDAYFASLAISNGATLVSSDRGFSSMKELQWVRF